MTTNKIYNDVVLSDDNSESEINEMQGTMPYSVIGASKKIPDSVYDLSEELLEKRAKVDFSDRKVKTAFWKVYKQALKEDKRMSLGRVAASASICVRTFESRFFGNGFYKLAWLLTPSTPYHVHVETLLSQSVERYNELISMDITSTRKISYKDENGEKCEKLITEVDAKKASVLLSVIKNLEERSLGSAVQRNVSIKTSEPSSDKDERVELDMDIVNSKLLELEAKLNNAPVTIEVMDE